jgi:hypothetical protein
MAEQKTGHQDQIIDAEVEPASAAVPPPKPARRSPLGVVVLVVVLAALVAGAAWWRFAPRDAGSKLLTAAAPATPVTPPADTRLEQLQKQVEALAARPDATARIQDLEQRLAAAEQKNAALERQLAERNRDDPTLGARVDGLVRALAELVETREQASAQLNAAAALLAVGQLREAALSGRSFEAELAALRELEDAPDVPDALAASAARGVPTIAALGARFAPVPRAIVTAGDEEGDDLRTRIERWVRRLVTVRPVGEAEGDDAAAIAARAEARVAAGDLAAAVRELNALSGPAADAAADWRVEAERRLAVENALGQLQAAAIAQAQQAHP